MRATAYRTLLAIAATTAITAGLLNPTTFAVAAPSDGLDVSASTPNTVPVFEPQVGRGSPLLAGQQQTISLGSAAASAHSALVRVSIFDAAADLEVAVGGAPALYVTHNRSASTSLLVALDAGAITVESSENANARIEVLALFASDADQPGATISIPAPTTRAATDDGLGLSTVGLVGLGGVPSEHVRAVYVTVLTSAGSPATIAVDGQSIDVPSGQFAISTVVTPSERGDIDIAIPSAVTARIDVRGYVAEAAADPSALNGPGSYWPFPEQSAETYETSDAAPTALDLGLASSNGSVLALLSSTAAEHLTLLEAGAPYAGRARGAVVDPVDGANPQLAVISVEQAALILRSGEATATLLPLGALLGADSGSSEGPAILLDSPTSTVLDVTEHITFTFSGLLETPGTSPLRVDSYLDGEPFVGATIRPGEGATRWSLTSVVPASGTYSFEFVVTDRAGGTARTTWSGTITLPPPTANVVSARAFEIGGASHPAEVLEFGSDFIVYDRDPGINPGDVIMSGVAGNAPAGYLRTVLAIDVVDGTWRVSTTYATLEDAYLRLTVDIYTDLTNSGIPTEVGTSPDEDAGYITSALAVKPVDEIDVEPLLGPVVSEGGPIPDFDPTPLVWSMRSMADTISVPTPDISIGMEIETSLSKSITVHGANDVDYSASVTGAVKSSVTLTHHLVIRIDVTLVPFEVELLEFTSSVVTTEKMSKTLTVAVGASWSDNIKGKPLTEYFGAIPIPGTPLVIIPSATFEAFVKVSLSGSISSSVSQSSQQVSEQGTRWLYGVPNKIETGPLVTSTPLSFTGTELEAKAEIAAGISLSFQLLLWDTAGPQLKLEVSAGVSLAVTANPDEDSFSLTYTVFIDATISLRFVVQLPVVRITLVDVGILSLTKRYTLFTGSLDSAAVFGGGGGASGPPGDGVPIDPSCVSEWSGGNAKVCTALEFTSALQNSSISKISLGDDISVCTLVEDETYGVEYCAPGSLRGVSVTRNLIIDLLSYDLLTAAMLVSPGKMLTVRDSTFGGGRMTADAGGTLGSAGIRITDAKLLVESGDVAGVGGGGGAGIGGNSGEDGGIVEVRGGSVNGIGQLNGVDDDNADGGAGIGGGLEGAGGQLIMRGGEIYGGGGDGAAGIGGGAFGSGGSVRVEGGRVTGSGGANLSEAETLGLYGSGGGAGIGGGYNASGGYFTANGGEVFGFGEDGGAGIGGGSRGYGGTISVTGGDVKGFGNGAANLTYSGAGIGGGYLGHGGTMTLSGGIVTGYSSRGTGAGIGGGSNGGAGGIIITGGTVTGFGDIGGAGIGGGQHGPTGYLSIANATVTGFGTTAGGAGIGSGADSMPSGSISIVNSTVGGFGGVNGAGIGSGQNSTVSTITIRGGSVNAYGGSGGAGIGSGAGGDVGRIDIDDTTMTGIGDDGGAGIGSGLGATADDIEIDGSTITAYSNDHDSGPAGSGIGSGANGIAGDLSISDCALTVGASGGGAGIGSGTNGEVGTIEMGNVTGTISSSASYPEITGGAGIGAGLYGVAASISIDGGNFTSYGTSAGIGSGYSATSGAITISGSEIEAYGDRGAGIGGGAEQNPAPITITNSTVTARTSQLGAGIGGGAGGDGGEVTITSSTIVASGGGGLIIDEFGDETLDGGAAIGGGTHGGGGTVSIVDSDVTLQPGQGGAGIGGGAFGDGGAVSVDANSIIEIYSTEIGSSAIGHGTGGVDFGSLVLDGALRLNAATLIIPLGVEVTISGSITGAPSDPLDLVNEVPGFVSGEGTLVNNGLLTAFVDPAVTVVGPAFAVTFEPNHPDAVDPATVVTTYVETFTGGRRHLGSPPSIAGWVFVEWNTSADGLGATFSGDTVLTGDLTVYAIWETE
jgi:hypothetical protein